MRAPGDRVSLWFWVMTLQLSLSDGRNVTCTIDGTLEVTRGLTREQAFRQILEEADRRWREGRDDIAGPAAVMFWSLEPRKLPVAGTGW